jgi:hypothetical protein
MFRRVFRPKKSGVYFPRVDFSRAMLGGIYFPATPGGGGWLCQYQQHHGGNQ